MLPGRQSDNMEASKRPHADDRDDRDDEGEPPSKSARALSEAEKSPVAYLNKLRRPLKYCVVSQVGPSHSTCFTVSVTVDGHQYVGSGPSKKAARGAAALKALEVVLRPEPSSGAPSQDFTSDDVGSRAPPAHAPPPVATAAEDVPVPVSVPVPVPLPVPLPLPADKSPINMLYEKYPDVTFSCEPVQGNSMLRFRVVCRVGGARHEGLGSSKRSAKLGAAKVALAALGVHLPIKALRVDDAPSPGRKTASVPDAPPPPSVGPHQTLADRIAAAVLDRFDRLVGADPVHARRKVLAGVVMTSGTNYENLEVIAVSSGTKCVSGERLSTCGLVVNDCHAEVVSRRCFQEFLYDCLRDLTDSPDGRGSPGNPLEAAPDGGYQVRGSYRFHLYISTAPCGDARIFSPHEETCRPPDRHPNRQARGQLRTKIESGEGTIPVKSSDGIQTWDGVLQGERLLTMSCSDKVARWNVLGLQGALLSVFLKPIYLESIILGSLLHPHHLYRAVCGRLVNTLKGLPPPFRLNRPMLIQCSSSEQRQAMRAPSFSVNWTVGRREERAEVINAVTGKTDVGTPSRLCKQNMFRKWLRLSPRLRPAPQLNWASYNANCVTVTPQYMNFDLKGIQYDVAKSKAMLYQNSKAAMYNAFLKGNLGKWLKKPVEQDQFEAVNSQ